MLRDKNDVLLWLLDQHDIDINAVTVRRRSTSIDLTDILTDFQLGCVSIAVVALIEQKRTVFPILKEHGFDFSLLSRVSVLSAS